MPIASAVRDDWVVVLSSSEGPGCERLGGGRGEDANAGTRLGRALERARGIVPPERVCVVIAPQELERGREPLAALPAENIVEQAQHCGSFFEILRGLLWVLGRQPSARVIGMPVDPVCQDERALQESLRRVAGGMARGDDLTLIGMKPIWPDPDLGYIVPGHRMADGTRRVYRVENRVGIELARDLVSSGGLWNSGCFVGRGSALLGMLCAARPKEVHQMQTALACLARPSWRSSALQRLYADLPTLDFAGVVLQSSEGRLRVLASVPLIDEKTAERI